MDTNDKLTKICYIKCNTCGRLLGTYMHNRDMDWVFPVLLEDSAYNMQTKAVSEIYVNGKIQKIYCTDRPCKPNINNMLPFIPIEEEEQ